MAKAKKQYRIQNWSDYNQSLVQRGSITFWISEEVAQAWMNEEATGKRGAPLLYSNVAILTCLMIRAVYSLTLRATQGFVDSLFFLMELDIPCPHYTRLSRRSKDLEVPLPRSQKSIRDVVVDASGLKVYGEGEWKVRQHGISKRRTWRKIHLAIDPEDGEILATVLTSQDVHDGEALGDLLEQIPGKIGSVSGDGAYDTTPCHEVISERDAKPIIPPRKNAVIKNDEAVLRERNKAIARIDELGGDDEARKAWKDEVGYHKRSLSETGVYRFKTLFGDNLASRTFETQATEVFIKAMAMNLMTSAGRPQSVPI